MGFLRLLAAAFKWEGDREGSVSSPLQQHGVVCLHEEKEEEGVHFQDQV